MSTPSCSFGWYELMTTNVSAARSFYDSVIGWTSHEAPGPAGSDFTFHAPSMPTVGVAGLMALPEQAGPIPAWIGYIHVTNVDEYIHKVTAAGGQLHRGPSDVPGILRFAVFTDPHGAPFILFTPDPAMLSDALRPKPPEIGTVSWNELYTGDLEAGFQFYSSVFGWTKLNDMDMGPMGTYRIFSYPGSTSFMGDGGLMTKPPSSPRAFWGFYFSVDSVSAAIERIKAGGGTVSHGTQQVPGGGWVANAIDPQGAAFSVVSSAQE